MKKTDKQRARIGEKPVALITLAVLLAITVFVGIISITGMPLDARGLYKLKAWVPSAQWPSALHLGQDLNGGAYAEYKAAQQKSGGTSFAEQLKTTVTILQNRLAASGVQSGTVENLGGEGVRITIPGVTNPGDIFEYLTDPAKLELLNPQGQVFLDNTNLESATYNDDPSIDGYEVDLTFVTAARKTYSDMAATEEGKKLAVRLNGTELSGAYVVPSTSDTTGAVIANIATQAQAQDLAVKLSSGTLPLTLTQQRLYVLPASYSTGALSAFVTAAGIGLAIAALFLIVRYRLSGLIACWALFLQIVLLFYLLAVTTGAKLSLPAVAGLLPAIGFSVTAAILILERLSEEAGQGRPIKIALRQSLKTTWPILFDFAAVTFIASLVLLIFGADVYKGLGAVLFFSLLTCLAVAVLGFWLMLSQAAVLAGKDSKMFIRAKAPAKEAQ